MCQTRLNRGFPGVEASSTFGVYKETARDTTAVQRVTKTGRRPRVCSLPMPAQPNNMLHGHYSYAHASSDSSEPKWGHARNVLWPHLKSGRPPQPTSNMHEHVRMTSDACWCRMLACPRLAS